MLIALLLSSLETVGASGTPIKSLAEMIDMYHGTVGQNSVMELDFAIDRTGGKKSFDYFLILVILIWSLVREVFKSISAH